MKHNLQSHVLSNLQISNSYVLSSKSLSLMCYLHLMNIPQNVSPNENYHCSGASPCGFPENELTVLHRNTCWSFLQIVRTSTKNYIIQSSSLSLNLSRANNILLLLTSIAQHGWMLHFFFLFFLVILEIFRNTHSRWCEPSPKT